MREFNVKIEKIIVMSNLAGKVWLKLMIPNFCPVYLECFESYPTAARNDTEDNKKISNDQELIQSDPTSCLKTKRETAKYIY